MAQAAARVEGSIPATVDVARIITDHSGPACLYDASRRPLMANARWLAAGLPGPGAEAGGTTPAALAVELLAASRFGRSANLVFTHDHVDGRGRTTELTLEATVVPVQVDGTRAAVVLGTDRTIIGTLQRALSESRDFHRSFVACSADFIWQVDGGGIIDYVGPRGLLDHSPEELFGAPIARFFVDSGEARASLVFVSREPVWEQEVWLADRKGDRHCFLVSAVPVRDRDGRWLGARGIGRDITEQRIREAELQRARHSQRMVHSVLHAMRSEVDPRAILDAAAVVAADTARLDACLVLKYDPEAGTTPEWVAMTLPSETAKAGFERTSEALIGYILPALAGGDRRLHRLQTGGCHFLISPTMVEDARNGAVVFGRVGDGGADPWTVEEEHILRAIAEQMGIALAQFDLVEGLRRGKGGSDAG
jgi:PAS domain S-box-containing protein